VCSELAELYGSGTRLVNRPSPVRAVRLLIGALEVIARLRKRALMQPAARGQHREHVDGQIEHPDLLGRIQPQVPFEEFVFCLASIPYPDAGLPRGPAERENGLPGVRISAAILLNRRLILQGKQPEKRVVDERSGGAEIQAVRYQA